MEDLFKKLGKITKPDNVFGLCVRFCLAQSQMFSTNVNGKTCTKPVLVAGGIFSTKLQSKHGNFLFFRAVGKNYYY
jgi:hypothetical protein